LDQQAGNEVTYTIQVTAREGDVAGVTTTDVPPEGFKYQKGSWTAVSSVRGDLKDAGITTEPTYASPGQWQLGDMQPDEVVTLTYRAVIQSDVDPGIYPDLAWAEGTSNTAPLLALSEPLGYVDTNFVGTQISLVSTQPSDTPIVNFTRTEDRTVIHQETKTETQSSASRRNGQVLGASTLPETGAHEFLTWLGAGLMAAGAALIGWGLKPQLRWSRESKLISILLIATAFFLAVPSVSFAAGLTARIENIPQYTNQTTFNIDYVTLDITGRNVAVACFKKGPSDASFSQFGSLQALKAGGDSGRCLVDSSVLTQNGTYQFYVQATAGLDVVNTQTVTMDYNKSSGPGPVHDYNKVRGNCAYSITFRTANDGKTSYVEIYRSDSTSLIANASTRVEKSTVGPNETRSITTSIPECSRNYYYAVRAFDAYGNGSTLVADSEVKYNDTIVTQTTTVTTTTDGGTTDGGTTTTTTNTGARPVTAANSQVTDSNDEAAAASQDGVDEDTSIDEGAVLGANTEDGSASDSHSNTTAAQTGKVLGTTDATGVFFGLSWMQLGLGALVSFLLLVGLWYAFFRPTKQSSLT
jgi:hypothetical protein